MRFIETHSKTVHDIFTVIISSVLLLVAGCGGGDGVSVSEIDLAPFKEMAMSADCADSVNRLFLIDTELVFWDRGGNCPDNAYAYILYAETVDDVLCDAHDTIYGPERSCPDDFYSEMFDAITTNLFMPDLGLGSGYVVEEILF